MRKAREVEEALEAPVPRAAELPRVLARPRVARARRLEPGRVRLERARPVTRRPARAGPARMQRRLRRPPIRRRTISIPVAVPPAATRPARRTGPARRTIRPRPIPRGRRPARRNRTREPVTLRMAFPSVRPGRGRALLNSRSVPGGRRHLRGASIGPEHRIASRGGYRCRETNRVYGARRRMSASSRWMRKTNPRSVFRFFWGEANALWRCD